MQSVSSHTLPLKSIPSWAELNKATDKKSTDDSQQGVKTINADAESKQWSTQDRKDHDEALKQQNLAALDSLKQSQAKDTASKFLFNADLNAKLSIWRGDITRLQVDAIVNAANETLLGGGGVDFAIHKAAGPGLRSECEKLPVIMQPGVRCLTGDAKITGGHKLPAKVVIHSVGPYLDEQQRTQPKLLASCYDNCLKLIKASHVSSTSTNNNGASTTTSASSTDAKAIRSIAFCCISTGFYGYPAKDAAALALHTVRTWLQTDQNAELVDRIIFACFNSLDYEMYQLLAPVYFPLK